MKKKKTYTYEVSKWHKNVMHRLIFLGPKTKTKRKKINKKKYLDVTLEIIANGWVKEK